MGIGTDNFGYPKPGEDDFYDIGVFNRAMDMVDKDLKDLGDKKQDKLAIGTFTGNIDVLGEGGLPQTSSICLCQSNKIEGVLPYESENEYWFTLKTSHAAEHSPGAARTQKAIVHSADGITVFGRMSMDGAWGGWRESLWADGDLKDNTCTFESDDEVLVKMGVPTIGGESQLEGYSTANGGRKWHTMPPLSIKDKFSEAIKKVTTLFHNVRYLYEVLGSSDISNLADGTVTGALSKLNTDLKDVSGIRFIDFGEYDHESMTVDEVIKEIFNKVPLDRKNIFLGCFVRGQEYKVVMQSYKHNRDHGSAILFSYAFPEVIFYRKTSGVLRKCTTEWKEETI